MDQQKVPLSAILGFAGFAVLMPLILFAAAGRFDWLMGWVYTGLFVATTMTSRIIVAIRFPELLAERASSLGAQDAQRWDRALVSLVAFFGPVATLVVAGLDDRFGWSGGVSAAGKWIAACVLAVGFGLAVWAMAVNRFYSAVVRIQKERGHSVVRNGPYRFVRHPSYIGGIIGYLATPLMLDAYWAFIPGALTAVGLIIRTALEDRTLLDELPGYADYAAYTRYRLIPGLW